MARRDIWRQGEPPGGCRGGAHRASRPRRKWRSTILTTAAGVLAIGLATFTVMSPKLLYNGSASAPIGFYTVDAAATIQAGDMVVLTPPPGMRDLIVERGYLPSDVPLVKRIVATKGDHVCAQYGVVAINDRIVLRAKNSDSRGRPMPVWNGCRVLDQGEVFVAMSDIEDSLDSRYFGPIDDDLIIGKVSPVWASTVPLVSQSDDNVAPTARPIPDQ
ncbi:MAG: S26 family signal peptidase [Hyphomicrobiales bacterium]